MKRLFAFYLTRLLKNHFHSIHISGEENLKKPCDHVPIIFYSNHSNWWDGFVAYYLSSMKWRLDDYLMMDIEQMKKYRFFKYLGVFSVDRSNSRSALETIEFAGRILRNSNRVLWMFPQGLIQSQDHRPIEFFSGITNLAVKLGRAALQPVAIRYEFVLEQRPEIFIRLGKADIIDSLNKPGKDFTAYLNQKLVSELDKLKDDVLKNNTGNYKVIFQGKESRNKTVDRITAR